MKYWIKKIGACYIIVDNDGQIYAEPDGTITHYTKHELAETKCSELNTEEES